MAGKTAGKFSSRPGKMFGVEKHGNKASIRASGEMYVENAAELRETVIELFEDGVRTLEIDLSGLEYIDSSGLGVLVGINNKCRRNGGTLKIGRPKGVVADLFTLTRLDLVFDFL